jgi:hypothetical protein
VVTGNFTASGSTNLWHWYDIAGATTSPFDLEADSQGANVGIESTLPAPIIAPSTPNGVMFSVLNAGTGPDAAITPGAILDNTPYTGEQDAGQVNNGDAWQHVFYRSTAVINVIYHLTKTTGWAATGVCFKGVPPVVQGSVPALGDVAIQQRVG